MLIVLLVSCASKQDDNKADIIKEKPTIDVNIKIIEGTLTDNECKLRIYNKGNETIGFGTKYILMIKNNEIWSELDCKDDWTGEMYFVFRCDRRKAVKFIKNSVLECTAAKYRLYSPPPPKF